MRGVIYALVDNTWDARYAIPFCTAFGTETDSESCLKETIQYLKTVFDKSYDDIIKECARLAASSPRCTELAAK
jgi:hypothetical protein